MRFGAVTKPHSIAFVKTNKSILLRYVGLLSHPCTISMHPLLEIMQKFTSIAPNTTRQQITHWAKHELAS